MVMARKIKSTKYWTSQQDKHVVIGTKITKEELEQFNARCKANHTIKYEVLKRFIRAYISYTK